MIQKMEVTVLSCCRLMVPLLLPLGPCTHRQLPHYDLYLLRSTARALCSTVNRLDLCSGQNPAAVPLPLLQELVGSRGFKLAGAALVAALQVGDAWGLNVVLRGLI